MYFSIVIIEIVVYINHYVLLRTTLKNVLEQPHHCGFFKSQILLFWSNSTKFFEMSIKKMLLTILFPSVDFFVHFLFISLNSLPPPPSNPSSFSYFFFLFWLFLLFFFNSFSQSSSSSSSFHFPFFLSFHFPFFLSFFLICTSFPFSYPLFIELAFYYDYTAAAAAAAASVRFTVIIILLSSHKA